MTFRELVQLLKDDRAVKGCRSKPPLKHLTKAFDGQRARSINGPAITAYERARLESGAARATVNNELAALRRMFNLAVEKRLLMVTQIPKIKTPNPRNARQGFFEADDFEAVVAELPPDLRPHEVRVSYRLAREI